MSAHAVDTETDSPARGWLSRIEDGLGHFGSFLVLVLIVLINADVIGRVAFKSPLPGVPELVAMAIVCLVFLQAPATIRRGRLTRSDGLIRRVLNNRPVAYLMLERGFNAAGALFFGLIALATVAMLPDSLRYGDFVGAIGVFTAPVWPMLSVIVLGAAFASLRFILLASAGAER